MEMGLVNGLADYLLVAPPDIAVYEKIMAEKEIFSRQYGGEGAAQAKPHICVVEFKVPEAMENTLIRWIEKICSLQTGFNVTLNNYGGFPPHTIYLRVQDPLPFYQLCDQMNSISDFFRSSGYPAKSCRKPYLSIAGKLPDEVYSKAIFDYSRKDFHESFQVTELVLLKRRDSFDSCKPVNIFRFLPAGGRAYHKVA